MSKPKGSSVKSDPWAGAPPGTRFREARPNQNEWAASQIWPSLESIALKCPRPLAGSGGFHWWYNDHEEMEKMEEAGVQIPYIPIICKTCGLKLKLSPDAPEYPGV